VDGGVERLRAFDPAAVERGRTAFGKKCSACHRANARGGEGFAGPDLIRSVIVLQDMDGHQIGEHLQARHKPPIPLALPDISDIATFLHRPSLQALIAFGTMRGGRGRGEEADPSRMGALRSARRATVTLPSGEAFSGTLVRLTDFDVTIRDDAGRTLSWLRNGNTPKVQVTDPLQGHVDLLPKYTDANIHDLAAYLATLK
jgi:hypothetical protein